MEGAGGSLLDDAGLGRLNMPLQKLRDVAEAISSMIMDIRAY